MGVLEKERVRRGLAWMGLAEWRHCVEEDGYKAESSTDIRGRGGIVSDCDGDCVEKSVSKELACLVPELGFETI